MGHRDLPGCTYAPLLRSPSPILRPVHTSLAMTICLLLPSAHNTASALEFTPTSRPVDSLFGAYGTSLSFWLSQLPVLRLNLISRLQLQGLGNDCWLNFIVQGPPCYAQAPYKQHLPVLSEAFLLSWRTLSGHPTACVPFAVLRELSGIPLIAHLLRRSSQAPPS